ncbi:hypothetical protein PV325_001525 [Microctonus aethiopoides]|nr:hypothetical protein PV325_001525 [Microctonus aethiopoides]KAK0097891.1 hypothetical protein PV326_012977 [Microctonus aethiopoides]
MISILQITVLLIVIMTAAGDLERVRREPEIQVYGLPKRLLKSSNNGAIDRIHLSTRLKINKSNDDTDSMTVAQRPRPLFHSKPVQISPINSGNVEGHLERVSLPTRDDPPMILLRKQRSLIQEEDSYGNNDDGDKLDDLEVAESKIFRPLFVYKQQVAERNKMKRSQNPIYGAYQYKPINKKQSNVKNKNFPIIREYY